jgi:hypothetical protein
MTLGDSILEGDCHLPRLAKSEKVEQVYRNESLTFVNLRLQAA